MKGKSPCVRDSLQDNNLKLDRTGKALFCRQNAEGLERIDKVVASELKKKRKTYNRALAKTQPKERVPGEEG